MKAFAPSNLTLSSPMLALGLTLFLTTGCAGDDDASQSSKRSRVEVTISGEELATDGIPFPLSGEVALVDGWSLAFSHVLVTVDHLALAENPDRNPADQSQHGDVVARAEGPWAIDLHRPGTVTGAAGEGRATPLAVIEDETERGHAAFAHDKIYAFDYDLVPASDEATLVNFADDEEATSLYAELVEARATVLYVGVATFEGAGCAVSDAEYDYSAFPQSVPFKLAFRTPTTFINCQNQNNQGDPFPDEEYPRGIAIPENAPGLAQITLHMDHPFFSATAHDPSLYFDPMAAQLVGKPEGSELTLEDLVGVDPSAFTDGGGSPLPRRSCDGSPLPPGKQLRFDNGSVPLDPAARPSEALRDYRDFVNYVQSSQGHLNGGEGLCFVQRNFPSPL